MLKRKPTKFSVVKAKMFLDQQIRKNDDTMPRDPEEACKMWDCPEFVRSTKILTPAKLDSAANW